MNPLRWLFKAAGFNLVLLLLGMTAQAQIAILDGTPLTIPALGAGPTINQSFTVSAGASVLVVILEDRQGGAIIPEPATIMWNGQTLTLDTSSLANASNYRSMAMYHLFNPPPGTGNITVTYSLANNTIFLSAFTLSGVDTSIAPVLLQTNSTATTTLSGTASGVAAGSWAGAASCIRCPRPE